MSPYEQMEKWYAEHPDGDKFGQYCDYFSRYEYLFSTPDYFVMIRAVVRAAGLSAFLDLSIEFPREMQDTWFVYAFAGDLSKVWDILPRELPWVAFEREHAGKRELTFVELSRVRGLTRSRAKTQFSTLN